MPSEHLTESAAPRWAAWAIEIVEISGALAAFGYMTLRAHWNHIGIVWLPGVGFDRYLMETHGILMHAVAFALAAAPLLLLLLLLFAGGRALLGRSTRGSGRVRGIVAALRPRAAWLLLALLVICEVLLLRNVVPVRAPGAADCRSDVALGALASRNAAGCFHAREADQEFYGIMAVCALAAWSYARRPQWARTAWTAVLVGTVVILFQLPTLYGVAIRPPEYSSVHVVAVEGETKGLLVLQTPEFVQIWSVAAAHGRMTVVPREQIRSIRTGEKKSLYDLAVLAVTNPGAYHAALSIPEGGGTP